MELHGTERADILNGGPDKDILYGFGGADTLKGGAGDDWAAYEDAAAGVKVDLNLSGVQNTGGGGKDKPIGVENVYGSDFNDRPLTRALPATSKPPLR